MESTGSLFLDGEWESICSGLFTSEQHDTDFSSCFFLPHHHQDAYSNGGGLLPLLNSQYSDPSQSTFDNVILQEATTQLTPCSSNNNHISQPSFSSGDTTATYTTPLDLGFYCQNDQFHSLQPFMNFLSMDTNKDEDHDDGGSFFTIPPLCDKTPATITNQATRPMIDGESAAGLNSHNADELELIQPQQQQQVTPTPKKRTRASKDGETGKRKVRVNKNKQPILTTEEDEEDQKPGKTKSSNTNYVQQSSNSTTDMIISDNESNAAILEKSNGDGTETINGKKIRANRGAATDPQSLYARKRRERINERLRILQNLVPNGIKVDISTMLEEAVHYVKFLQLQIKLLSSDDMWMYAPLAYSGFDMGLYRSFSPYMMKPQGF